MTQDDRFGLPLSLVEALELDRSQPAAELARLLRDPSPVRGSGARRRLSWGAPVAALAGALALGTAGQAAASSMEGRWVLLPGASRFAEAVTGAAPDRAVVQVTRDDGDRFAYDVVESRDGMEVARASYAVTYAGGAATSRMGGAVRRAAGRRDAGGDVVITAPAVAGLHAVIRVRRTGEDTAEIEHAVEGPDGSATLETLRLVRGGVARAD